MTTLPNRAPLAAAHRDAAATLHLESAGNATAPDLVLLHGWGLHGGLFAPLLPSLVERHRVHVVDLAGHGHSQGVVARTLDAQVDALLATLDAAGIARARILGWSFGGLLAQRLARRAPSRVDALVLVATSPRFVAVPGWPNGVAEDVLARFGDELRVAWEPTVRRFLTLQMHGAEDARGTLALLRRLAASRPAASAAALHDALGAIVASDLRDDAAALRMPALVVSGGRDVLAPAGAGAWLAGAMPTARYAPIEPAAHIPFLSHRAAFLAALDGFADAHPA